MPDPQFVQLPFGPGLDKETGMMVVKPNTMQDLRNVYHHEGSLVVREGVEKTNSFQDGEAGWSQGGWSGGTGDDATHILAGIAIRSERAGIVVSWHSTYKRVAIWRVNGLGEESTFVGFWPWRSDHNGTVITMSWPFDEPPKVILAEMYGQVFFAHDTYYDTFRADTYFYNPWGLVTGERRLGPLTSDFNGDGIPEVIRFRGVVRHLHYLFGWGWGGKTSEPRPELLRVSLPGEPTKFDVNHYFIVGDRRDPIVSAEPARQTLLVCKETATYQVIGYSRATFGCRPYDNLYGSLAGRLITSVSGTVFVWSAEGPMMGGDVGGFEKIWLPLDLGGFEPATLVERADFEDGWADYIDEVELVIFCFGRRAYILSLRNPADPRWTYWELGKKAFCGFRLWGGEDVGGVPTGNPTIASIAYEVEGCGLLDYPRYIITVTHSGQSPTDLVQVYHRPMGPFWGDNLANDPLSTDSDGDGVPDNWELNYVAPYHLNYYSAQELAYRIALGNSATDTTDTNDYIELLWTTPAVTVGTRYRLEAEVLTLQEDSNSYANAPVQIQVQYYDIGDSPVGALQSRDCRCPIWQRVWMEGTAPASATYAKVGIRGDVKTAGDIINAAIRTMKWMEEDVTPGDWVPAATPQLVTGETTQELPPITVTEPGMDYEVAIRYVNIGLQAPPAYPDDDPSTWPAGAQDTAEIPMDAPDWRSFYDAGTTPAKFFSYPLNAAGNYFIMAPGCDLDNVIGPYGLKYANRDLEVQQDGVTIGYMHRGTPSWAKKVMVAELYSSYQFKMRYLGPDRNSPFGAAITVFAGLYEGVPTITELTGERGGYLIFIVRSQSTYIPDPNDPTNYEPVGVQIQDNYDAVTGGQLLPAGSWNTVWVSQYSALPKTGATRLIYPPTDEILHGNRANGLTVSVRVRQYYEEFPLTSSSPEQTFTPGTAGPWSEVRQVTIG